MDQIKTQSDAVEPENIADKNFQGVYGLFKSYCLQTRFLQKINFNNKKNILMGVIVLIAAMTIFPLFYQHTQIHTIKPQAPLQNPLQGELNDISEKLANVESDLAGNKDNYVNVNDLKSDLVTLITEINQIAKDNSQVITSEITKGDGQLDTKLDTIKKSLSAIEAQNGHHKVIDASNLPFEVISIDNIEENDVATVKYDDHTLPIELNDSIAGWTLTAANTEDQKAEFENKDQNYIDINLNAAVNSAVNSGSKK